MQTYHESCLSTSPFPLQEHELDLAELLSASAYKEKYRSDMILWGEQRRNADPGYALLSFSTLKYTHHLYY